MTAGEGERDRPDELDRLRRLVGPSEDSYVRAIEDLDAAQAVARDAQAEAGRLRAQIVELELQLIRARRAAGRLAERAEMAGPAYLRSLCAEAWTEIRRPRLAAVKRRTVRR